MLSMHLRSEPVLFFFLYQISAEEWAREFYKEMDVKGNQISSQNT